jgi:hypothetical protein
VHNREHGPALEERESTSTRERVVSGRERKRSLSAFRRGCYQLFSSVLRVLSNVIQAYHASKLRQNIKLIYFVHHLKFASPPPSPMKEHLTYQMKAGWLLARLLVVGLACAQPSGPEPPGPPGPPRPPPPGPPGSRASERSPARDPGPRTSELSNPEESRPRASRATATQVEARSSPVIDCLRERCSRPLQVCACCVCFNAV